VSKRRATRTRDQAMRLVASAALREKAMRRDEALLRDTIRRLLARGHTLGSIAALVLDAVGPWTKGGGPLL
jgi:hypothetical protein